MCIRDSVIDKPFLMAIEDVFSIKGRGTVVTGRVERGIVKTGEEVEIVGFRDTRKTVEMCIRDRPHCPGFQFVFDREPADHHCELLDFRAWATLRGLRLRLIASDYA